MDTAPKLYDYVMTRLRAKQVPQRQVANESGVPFSTLTKIAQGQIKDPSVHTIQRLADYFAAREENQAPGEHPVGAYTGPERRLGVEPGQILPKRRSTNGIHKEEV